MIVPTVGRRVSAVAHRFTRCTEIGGHIEAAYHRAKPFGKFIGDTVEQERDRTQLRRAPLPRADERAVKNHRT